MAKRANPPPLTRALVQVSSELRARSSLFKCVAFAFCCSGWFCVVMAPTRKHLVCLRRTIFRLLMLRIAAGTLCTLYTQAHGSFSAPCVYKPFCVVSKHSLHPRYTEAMDLSVFFRNARPVLMLRQFLLRNRTMFLRR